MSDSSEPDQEARVSARGLADIISGAQATTQDEGRQLGIAGVDYDTIYLSIGKLKL